MTACIKMLEARIASVTSKEPITVTDEQLLKMIPAPDFPTGALLLNAHEGAKQLYTTGNGGIIMRAVTHVEKIVNNNKKNTMARTAIIVTELPYQTNKSTLLEKIANLVNEKKLEGISDLRDESDRDGIRIVLELKRDAVADVVLNNLFKKTPLQTSFSGNLVALMKSTTDSSSGTSNGSSSTSSGPLDATATSMVPQRITLRTALDCFLDFRFETVRHKSRLELQTVQARAHIVRGLLLALAKIDDVIAIIRQAPDTATAKQQLIEEVLVMVEEDIEVDENIAQDPELQADAILRLQLGQLTRLNKDKLEKEQDDLTKQAKGLTKLIKDDTAVYKLMQKESQELMDKFGSERKSRIVTEENGELEEIDLIRNSRSGKMRFMFLNCLMILSK